MGKRQGWIELWRDKNEFFFAVCGGNGKKLFTSEPFVTRQARRNSIDAVRDVFSNPNLEKDIRVIGQDSYEDRL